MPAVEMKSKSHRKPTTVHGEVNVLSTVLTCVASNAMVEMAMSSLSIGRFARGKDDCIIASPVRVRFIQAGVLCFDFRQSHPASFPHRLRIRECRRVLWVPPGFSLRLLHGGTLTTMVVRCGVFVLLRSVFRLWVSEVRNLCKSYVNCGFLNP